MGNQALQQGFSTRCNSPYGAVWSKKTEAKKNPQGRPAGLIMF
jgi:hypothetical protein